jgi:hypothetical protein
LVWSKTVGKSGCVNERQPDDDDEMQISNIWQSNKCGEGTTKTITTTITTTNGRAGIRAYWGCMYSHRLEWFIFMGWDEFDGQRMTAMRTRTHTTTNQTHAAIMEDVRTNERAEIRA